jgi:hypothetical protein
MAGYCSTGQSPQQDVVPMEEEEEFLTLHSTVATIMFWKCFL